MLFIQTRVLSWILSQQGYYEEANEYLSEAIDIAKQTDDVLWQCEALLISSQALRRRNALEEAFAACQQALLLVADSQYAYEQANIEYELGKIARDRGHWQAAQSHFLTARNIFGQNDRDLVANIERTWGILGQLGFVMHQLGDLDDAAQTYLQALEFCRETGGKGYMTTLLVRLASLEEQRGNLATALEHAREALEWSRRLGMVQEQAQAEAIVGRLNR
jgi:tetratricopeptide (TPR) repeat protein